MNSIVYSVVIMQFGGLDVLHTGGAIHTSVGGVHRSLVMLEIDEVRLHMLCMAALSREGAFASPVHVHEFGVFFMVVRIIAMVFIIVEARDVLDDCPSSSVWQARVHNRGEH